MSEPTPLGVIPRRALVVVAHPDDAEYGTSAAVASWVEAGAEVAYLLLTTGEAGMQRSPDEVGPLRAAEQRAACDIVGVHDLTILHHPDGVLEPTLDLRRDIAREIRRFRPDTVVITTWELVTAWGLNHADHRAVGIATVDAIRDADNTWVFPELASDEDLPKHKVERLLVGGASDPNVGVIVDEDAVAKAVASLAAHEAYLADLPDHPAPDPFIRGMLAAGGERLGVPYAMLYREFTY